MTLFPLHPRQKDRLSLKPGRLARRHILFHPLGEQRASEQKKSAHPSTKVLTSLQQEPLPKKDTELTVPRLNRGWNNILTSIALALLSSASTSCAKDLWVRVTYYNAQDCPYGSRTATGRKAIEGITCAVDPRIIPYGSIIEADALEKFFGDRFFIAHDTGSAVKRRIAARRWGRNVPVIDIYIKTRKRANYLASTLPMFMRVKIHLHKKGNREYRRRA